MQNRWSPGPRWARRASATVLLVLAGTAGLVASRSPVLGLRAPAVDAGPAIPTGPVGSAGTVGSTGPVGSAGSFASAGSFGTRSSADRSFEGEAVARSASDWLLPGTEERRREQLETARSGLYEAQARTLPAPRPRIPRFWKIACAGALLLGCAGAASGGLALRRRALKTAPAAGPSAPPSVAASVAVASSAAPAAASPPEAIPPSHRDAAADLAVGAFATRLDAVEESLLQLVTTIEDVVRQPAARRSGLQAYATPLAAEIAQADAAPLATEIARAAAAASASDDSAERVPPVTPIAPPVHSADVSDFVWMSPPAAPSGAEAANPSSEAERSRTAPAVSTPDEGPGLAGLPEDARDWRGSRGPAQDPDLRLPPLEAAPEPSSPRAGVPATSDGRELARLRRAVLRLSAAGWNAPQISESLRLGAADVDLILKTAGASRAVRENDPPRRVEEVRR